MEAVELKEKGLQNIEILKHASNKLREASKKLEVLLSRDKVRVSPSWYSDLRRVEDSFVENLKYHAVPALQNGQMTTHQLEHIALAFVEKNTEQMKLANEIMEKFEEIKIKSQYLNYFNLFYRNKIGKLLLSIIFGFTLVFSLLWIHASFTNQNFSEYIANPTLIITSGLAGSSFIYLFMRKE